MQRTRSGTRPMLSRNQVSPVSSSTRSKVPNLKPGSDSTIPIEPKTTRFSENWKRKTTEGSENVAPVKRSKKDITENQEDLLNQPFMQSQDDSRNTRTWTGASRRLSLGRRDITGLFRLRSDGASTSSSTSGSPFSHDDPVPNSPEFNSGSRRNMESRNARSDSRNNKKDGRIPLDTMDSSDPSHPRIIECGLRDDGTICECRTGDLERSTSNLQSTVSRITSIKPSLQSTSSQPSSVQSTSIKSSVPLQSTSNIRTAQQGGSNLRSSPTNCRKILRKILQAFESAYESTDDSNSGDEEPVEVDDDAIMQDEEENYGGSEDENETDEEESESDEDTAEETENEMYDDSDDDADNLDNSELEENIAPRRRSRYMSYPTDNSSSRSISNPTHRCTASCPIGCRGGHRPLEIVIFEGLGMDHRVKPAGRKKITPDNPLILGLSYCKGLRRVGSKGNKKTLLKTTIHPSSSSTEHFPVMPQRVHILYDTPEVPLDVALEHTWNPQDRSFNMRIKEGDPFTVRRQPVAQSTDSARTIKGYSSGLHIFRVTWPLKQRGTHACIGVCTANQTLHSIGYNSQIGLSTQSWGWDLGRLKAYHNASKISGVDYPASPPPDFKVRTKFFLVLDCDAGTLGFISAGRWLGIAHSGLQGQVLYPSVSCVWGQCEVTLRYHGSLVGRACSLSELCRAEIRKRCLDFSTLPVPRGVKKYLKHQ
ncbi:uncharacterized protein LOC111711918 [Eurytemora carolleeae]|uniref:uncharacterized protein LOC111711918 n=1 Tax=Eurytemora carolleeae TaxID=1294199 RepID=UPI000C7707EA|nr:uncharacterized protein LOC111711918 [Eurytemora carolleeae]|eukprot:XP_023342168.1 uncharacterized protein LOC111711918 [Eurytemora affinis]